MLWSSTFIQIQSITHCLLIGHVCLLQAWQYNWVDEDFPALVGRVWSHNLLHSICHQCSWFRFLGGPYPPSHLFTILAVVPKCARVVVECYGSQFFPIEGVRSWAKWFLYSVYTSHVMVALTISTWTVLTHFWWTAARQEWGEINSRVKHTHERWRWLARTKVASIPRHARARQAVNKT